MKTLLIDGTILFIATLWQIICQTYILQYMFNLNYSTVQRSIYSISISLYVTLFKLLSPDFLMMWNPLFFIVLSTLLLFFILKISLKRSISYALFILLISIPIEMFVGFIFNSLSIPGTLKSILTTLPILLIINIIFTIIALCLYFYRNKISNKFFSLANDKFVYVNILIIVLLIVPNTMFYAYNRYNYPLYLLIYNIFSSIILVLLSVYNTYKNIQLEVNTRQLENSEFNNRNLSKLIDSIRVFKHDYNNVVHAIGGYIALEDMEGLKKYFSGLIKDSQKANNLEAINPQKINEPSIYNIIASKHQIADLKNISFNLDSLFNFQKLAMPVYDFCKILGILLDNALEASYFSKEKVINIFIRENLKQRTQIITIENTYSNKDVDLVKIFEKDYSTKQKKSGLGLWEVKNIIEKNKNVNIYTTKDEKFFKQEIIIFLNENEYLEK